MRTTLTLDRDVAEAVAREMRRTRTGLKATVNEALRKGLRMGGSPARRTTFKVAPHAFGVRTGVDLDRLNQLTDELDAQERRRTLLEVILPDINLLLHAYNSESSRHAAAKAWWEMLLNGSVPVGLSWATMLGFIRIATHRQVFAHPLPVAMACAHVRTWLSQSSVSIVEPGSRHADILFSLLESLGTAGNLTSDAHLAALAIEYQAELHSTDADFGRFAGLRWVNPLAPR